MAGVTQFESGYKSSNTTATGVGQTVFKGLKTPRSVLEYNLMKGVTDFSNLEQFDLYEKGYPWLVVIKAPQFLVDLAMEDQNGNGSIMLLLKNYIHILEHDFRGLDNVENITGEPNGEITNGIRSIQLINKVTKGAATTFTMRYYERSGSTLTKLNELYLTGIKDPDTQVKTYHGLIDKFVFGTSNSTNTAGSDPGPHQEVWSFMYFLTDNTATKIEKAFLICAAQQTTAEFSTLYYGDKGDIGWGELSMTFNGFFINNDQVSLAAQRMLLAMRNPNNTTASRVIVDSTNFTYQAIADVNRNMGLGGDDGFTINEDVGNWQSANGQADTDKVDSVGGRIGSASDGYGSKLTSDSTDGVYYSQVQAINNKSMGYGEHILSVEAAGETKESNSQNES